MTLDHGESAPPGWKVCWSVFAYGTPIGPFHLVGAPTYKSAEFVAESLALLWGGLPVHDFTGGAGR